MAIYHILKRMQDLSGTDFLEAYRSKLEMKKILEQLESDSASIEFIRDEQIQRVHFYQQCV
jgi:hypothetical protein